MAFRCFLPAWIAAWAAAVFLPSAIIAFLGISHAAAAIGTGLHSLPATTWKVADDVGPAVKLMIGGLLLLCFVGLIRAASRNPAVRYAAGIVIGMAVMVVTIAFIPAAFSRGFAAALTGPRFAADTTAIYLIGGAAAGLAFVSSYDRCGRDGVRAGSGRVVG